MTTNETSGQESSGRTDIEITVCTNGVVNVHRPESARAHSVFVGENGDVLRCSCKGHHYRGHCSHQRATAARDGQRVATDGGRVIDAETCDECGLVLDDAHEQPAGYVELTTDGEALCGACADIRYDRYRGDRKTADELADDQDGDGTDTEASGTSMTRTATGWASSSTSATADESETVDETPL